MKIKYFLMTLATAIFVSLGTFTACNHRDKRQAYRGDYELTAVDNLRVLHPSTSSEQDKGQQVSSAVFALLAWEEDFERKSSFVTLRLIDALDFACGITDAIGCYYGNGDPAASLIKATVGEGQFFNAVPALYHELCHQNMVSEFGVDPEHEDPDWEIWTQRGFEIAATSGRTNLSQTGAQHPVSALDPIEMRCGSCLD